MDTRRFARRLLSATLALGLLGSTPAGFSAQFGVLSTSANVRSAQSMSSLAFDAKQPGTRFRILAEKAGTGVTDSWLKVQFEDGTIGWIMSTTAQRVDATELSVQKQIAAAETTARINTLRQQIVGLEQRYEQTGTLAFDERKQLLEQIAARRQHLDTELAKAGTTLSANQLTMQRQAVQNDLDAARKQLENLSWYQFTQKKLLTAKIEGLQKTLGSIPAAPAAIPDQATVNQRAQAFLDELLGRTPPSGTVPALPESASAVEKASFSAPDISLPEAERQFKERYQEYIDLSGSGAADPARVEAAHQAYLKAYNIYKHHAQASLKARSFNDPNRGLRMLVDRPNRLIQLYAADGELLRSFPITAGPVDGQGPERLAVSNLNANPWYRGDGLDAAPGLSEAARSRWLGIGGSALTVQGSRYLDGFGSKTAAGCVRMFSEDVDELADLIAVGTPVTVKK